MHLKYGLIEKRKREWGLKRSNSFYKKKLFNESFFHCIDCEEKAYWLGFLFADGSVYKRGTSCIISIRVKDKEICDKFLKSINANFETYSCLCKDSYHPNLKHEVYSVDLFSKEMFNDLNNYGCVPNKSLILQFPNNISKEFIPHFIRGYFDGDGCVTIGKRNNSTKYNNIHIEYCGTLEFLTELNNNLPFKGTVSKEKRLTTNTYKLSKSGTKNAKIFFKYLYTNATVYLERKYNKFLEYFTDRNINIEDVQRA